MARRSLRPQLNQIRAWARQGRTDAWIAHQLEVTVQQVQEFRRENDLLGDADAAEAATGVDFDEIDLRAEDDALIAAELEAAAAEAAARAEEQAALRAQERALAAERGEDDEQDEPEEPGDSQDATRTRRRGRRGGRGRGRRAEGPLQGTFDHGEDGYGLWLDPAVQDNPVYAEHWAGHRQVEVSVEEEQIVIRRAGGDQVER